MTQKELIEFCKENDPNYNKDASFKENFEPMWSIPKGVGGIGITESEFKNGFYVEIDTKGRKGFEHLEGRVFYFREKVEPSKYCFQIYNSHWKKFFVPLTGLEVWGKEIVKETFEKPFEEFTEFMEGIVPEEVQKIEELRSMFDKEKYSHEEFPIVKAYSQNNYIKRNCGINVGSTLGNEVDLFIIMDFNVGPEKILKMTTQEFSDLVDLMTEARKDLLK